MQIVKANNYNIYFGNKALNELNKFLLSKKYSSHYVICDDNSFRNCYPALLNSCKVLKNAEIIEIDAGEESKNLEICSNIWKVLLEFEADRNAVIINLGGGVISDLGGFIASVYKRGIDFINVPTTLLAMADASVGGKTGIDFFNLKNVIGSFAYPKAIFINTEYLETLPARQKTNGVAEILKMALIYDKKLWQEMSVDMSMKNLATYLFRSVELKNQIVLKDPLEKGTRKILNFGHTIGHAVEAILLTTPDKLLHGEAVIVGMIAEAYISKSKKLLTEKSLNEIIKVLKDMFTLTPVKEMHFEAVKKLIMNDKKNLKGKVNFSLISGIGKSCFDQSATPLQISDSLLFYNKVANDKS